MSNATSDSPFERPTLTEGYPLEKEERASLKEAIREIEAEPSSESSSDEPTDGTPDRSEQPAGA